MKKLIILFITAFTLTSCAIATSPVTGFVYTDVQSGVTATSNSLGTKVGKATAKSILGIIGTGDASIQAAAKSAGITKISHVDQSSKSILGIIATYEVIVYGN